jgi:hypothetical protein
LLLLLLRLWLLLLLGLLLLLLGLRPRCQLLSDGCQLFLDEFQLLLVTPTELSSSLQVLLCLLVLLQGCIGLATPVQCLQVLLILCNARTDNTMLGQHHQILY